MGLFNIFKSKNYISEKKLNEIIKQHSNTNPQTIYQLSLYGVKDTTELKIEFFFNSDTKEKLVKLESELLKKNYSKTKIEKIDNIWSLNGWTTKLNMTQKNINIWTTEMCKIGFNFDCEFDGWGTNPNQDPKIEIEENLSIDQYFKIAFDHFYAEKFIESEAYYNKVIELSPKDVDAFYNRAIVKSSRGNKLGAIADFDKAIEINPNFINAYSNRGADKDDIGDYKGAIEDYKKNIELDPKSTIAYLNMGNSYFHLGNSKKACENWKIASELGDEIAKKNIESYCK